MLRLVVVLVAVMASGVAWAQAGSEHGVQVGMGLALGVTLGPFEGRSRVHVVTHAFSEATVRWDAENRGLRRAPWVRPVLGGSLAVRIRRPVQVEPMARAGVALLDDAAGNLGHITRARGVFDAGIAWRPATGEWGNARRPRPRASPTSQSGRPCD